MDCCLLPSSPIKLPAPCSLRRSTSSFPYEVKKITTRQQLSSGLPNYSQIFASTKLRYPVFSSSNFWRKGQMNRVNAMQDSAQAEQDISNTILVKMSHFSHVLWRFMRPYVMRGYIVGYIGILARTWIEHPHPLGWSQIFKALAGLVALLCYGGYNCGINQIFDVEIDRINKPYLPIASGELTIEVAWLVVTIFAVAGITIARALNYGPLTSLICGLYSMGTIYSVPPFSMKRSTFGAILVVTLGRSGWTLAASSAARASVGLPFVLSKPIIFMSITTALYALAMAVVKDISDIEGDKQNKVPTLATMIGVRNVAFIGCGLLLLDYISAISAAIFMPQVFNRMIMIPVHTVLALSLIFQIWKVDRANYKKEESQALYQFLWNMMCVEYALFPFI